MSLYGFRLKAMEFSYVLGFRQNPNKPSEIETSVNYTHPQGFIKFPSIQQYPYFSIPMLNIINCLKNIKPHIPVKKVVVNVKICKVKHKHEKL